MKTSLYKKILVSILSTGFVMSLGVYKNVYAAEPVITFIKGYGNVLYNVNVSNISSAGSDIAYITDGVGLGTNSVGNGSLIVYGGDIANVSAALAEKGETSDSVLTVQGGSVDGVAAGGISMGNVSRNSATIQRGDVFRLVGGYALGKGTAVGNTAVVKNGVVNGYAAGGVSEVKGLVKDNKLEITGGIVGLEGDYRGSFGGLTFGGGKAENNEASIENARTYLIAGAATEKTGSATGNKVVVKKGAEIEWAAAGAFTENGLANYNSAEMEGGLVWNLVGGYSEGKGSAIGNTAVVKDGIVNGYAAGGVSEVKGLVKENKIEVTGGIIGLDDDYSGTFGGLTFGGGKAEKNEAYIENAKTYLITGAATEKSGSALGNKVVVKEGSEIEWTTAGAFTEDGSANNNVAEMYGGLTWNLVGGFVEGKGSANGNSVTLENGTVHGSAIGGLAMGKGSASKNTLTIKNGTIEAYSDEDDDSYQGAYGGLSQNGGKTDYNIVNMSGGEAYLVCGGATVLKGSATGNKVTISGDSWVDWGVAGGAAIDGACKNNIVDINGGDIGNVVGAYVGDAGDDSAPIYGKGSASGNIVSITGGIIRENAGGARTIDGSASKNEIRITEGTVGGDTFGAFVEGNGSAVSNKVIVSGGHLQDVYGASTFNKGAATSNSVLISGASTQTGNIFGAYSEAGAASKNTVTINAGTTQMLVGGEATLGAASSNAVYINGGNINYIVAGGITEGGKLTSNKVEINGGSITAENIYGAKGVGATYASGNAVKIAGNANVQVGEGIYGALLNNVDDETGRYLTEVLGSASSNTVVINNVDASVVYGASVNGNGNASKNSVTINNGEYGIVTGALVCNEGDVSGNKVTISGDVTCSSIYGGSASVGTVSKNVVTLTGNIKVSGNIIAGDTFGGRAENNTVTAKGNINAEDSYICGGSAFGRRSTGNAVNLNGGKYGTVEGGYSENAECMSNKVTIINATVKEDVTGGYGVYNKVTGNKVTITDSKIGGTIYGGYNGGWDAGGYKNDVTANKVTITNCEVVGSVYGGYQINDREVSSNSVTIKDSTIHGSVYGGYSESGVTKKNSVTISNSYIEGDVVGGNKEDTKSGNKVTLSGNTTVDGDIWGYQSGKGIPEDKKGANEEHRNNVLQLNNYSGSVRSLHDIDSIVATNVNWQNGGTLLTVRNAVDEGLEVNVESISGFSRVRVGDSMTLLAAEGTEDIAETEQASTTARVGYGLNAELDILDNVATVRTINVSEAAKGIGESRTAATAFVNQGSDLIEDSLRNLDSATDGVNTFASMQGNTSRYETGSHIKVNGKSGIVGVYKSVNEGKITYGAFFENGSGNYNTHFDGNRGDGKAVYNGGGLLLNTKLDKGVYVEASIRAGKLKNDLKNALAGGQGYHTETTYYGAHLGIGKLIEISETTQLDVYGKYIYTHNSDESFMIEGQKYEFDDLDSSRLKAGLRINRKVNDKLSLYYGTAYEYELDGKATNKVAGYDMNNPELKGGTILGEVGVTCKASSKWSLDWNVKGYAGQRDGFATNVQAVYSF